MLKLGFLGGVRLSHKQFCTSECTSWKGPFLSVSAVGVGERERMRMLVFWEAKATTRREVKDKKIGQKWEHCPSQSLLSVVHASIS